MDYWKWEQIWRGRQKCWCCALWAFSSAAPPPASNRDLLAEAWDRLNNVSKERLRTTITGPGGNSSSIYKVPEGNKAINRRHKSSERGRKWRSTAIKSIDVQQVIPGTQKALDVCQRRWGSGVDGSSCQHNKEDLVICHGRQANARRWNEIWSYWVWGVCFGSDVFRADGKLTSRCHHLYRDSSG